MFKSLKTVVILSEKNIYMLKSLKKIAHDIKVYLPFRMSFKLFAFLSCRISSIAVHYKCNMPRHYTTFNDFNT